MDQAWKRLCARLAGPTAPLTAGLHTAVVLAATVCCLNTAAAQVGPNGQLLVTVEDPPLSLTCEDTISVDIGTDELVKLFGGETSVARGIASEKGDFLRGAIDVNFSSPVPAIRNRDYRMVRGGLGYCRVDWDVGLVSAIDTFNASNRQLEITVATASNGRLRGPNNSRVDVRRIRFRDPDAGAAYGTRYTPIPRDHQLAGTLPIELEFELQFDLRRARSAGLHRKNRAIFTVTLDYL